jgi:hypothetical protein
LMIAIVVTFKRNSFLFKCHVYHKYTTIELGVSFGHANCWEQFQVYPFQPHRCFCILNCHINNWCLHLWQWFWRDWMGLFIFLSYLNFFKWFDVCFQDALNVWVIIIIELVTCIWNWDCNFEHQKYLNIFFIS